MDERLPIEDRIDHRIEELKNQIITTHEAQKQLLLDAIRNINGHTQTYCEGVGGFLKKELDELDFSADTSDIEDMVKDGFRDVDKVLEDHLSDFEEFKDTVGEDFKDLRERLIDMAKPEKPPFVNKYWLPVLLMGTSVYLLITSDPKVAEGVGQYGAGGFLCVSAIMLLIALELLGKRK